MNVGGPSNHVVNLAEGLNKYNCATLLISGQPSKSEGEMFALADNKNFKLKKIEYLKRPISLFYDLLSFIKIVKAIKDFSPDIVHTHTTKAGILGRAAAFGSKTVLLLGEEVDGIGEDLYDLIDVFLEITDISGETININKSKVNSNLSAVYSNLNIQSLQRHIDFL